MIFVEKIFADLKFGFLQFNATAKENFI